MRLFVRQPSETFCRANLLIAIHHNMVHCTIVAPLSQQPYPFLKYASEKPSSCLYPRLYVIIRMGVRVQRPPLSRKQNYNNLTHWHIGS